jgi:hypothetical protein
MLELLERVLVRTVPGVRCREFDDNRSRRKHEDRLFRGGTTICAS